jgi:RNase P/RNase MRP subunit p29
MQITPDILIKRGHEIKVTTKDGAKVLHMAINGRDFYFNPEKLTNEPMFNDYFDKIYG